MNILVISIIAIIIIVVIIIVVVMNSSDDDTVNSSSNSLYCPEINSSATALAWPKTESGKTASQNCPTGYTGTITRLCSNGTWSDEDRTSCTQIIYCPADGDWPKTAGNTTVDIDCPTGYTGNRTRTCKGDGTWSNEDRTSCSPQIFYCPADGDWPKTAGNTTVDIDCPTGYTGNRTRTCKGDGTWSNEDRSSCVLRENDSECKTVTLDISSDQVIITLAVKCTYDNDVIIKDFTFTANVKSIAKDYINIKDTIPTKLKSQVGKNVTCTYPAKLQVFKNDEYLIIVSDHTTKLTTYSYDYPYNYINNSVVTIQSKTLQDIKPTDNILYKIWTSIKNPTTFEVCKTASLGNIMGRTIGQLYTNKYINFCLILIAMWGSNSVLITSLGDCTVTFKTYAGRTINLMLSKDELCSGVYTFADMKNNFTNFCKTYNTTDGKGWTYTIDLNKPYKSSPSVYSLAESKNITIFDTGSQMFDDKKIKSTTKTTADWIPQISCNHIDLQ